MNECQCQSCRREASPFPYTVTIATYDPVTGDGAEQMVVDVPLCSYHAEQARRAEQSWSVLALAASMDYDDTDEDNDEDQVGLACADCGSPDAVESEYYMVHDELWAAAGMGPDDGLLCIGCIESRLGRQLSRADFTDAPLNDPKVNVSMSARLLSRLAAPTTAPLEAES